VSDIKALALFSGGLDSMLAVRLVQEEGVTVEGICFVSPFFGPETATKMAQNLNLKLRQCSVSHELIALLHGPTHGFGKGANPCIDCHTVMIRRAGAVLREKGFHFLVSGDVLGERPKSQNRWALQVIDRESGWGDLILRPLPALNLSPTLPERSQWVRREHLYGIRGRSRAQQLELADRFGIHDYPAPAGGCRLTDPEYARRVKDLLQYDQMTVSEAELLKVGRHFRLDGHTRVVVGRNQGENQVLMGLVQKGDFLFRVRDYPGPIGVLRGEPTPEAVSTAASLVVRYSQARHQEAAVECLDVDGQQPSEVRARALDPSRIEQLRIGGTS